MAQSTDRSTIDAPLSEPVAHDGKAAASITPSNVLEASPGSPPETGVTGEDSLVVPQASPPTTPADPTPIPSEDTFAALESPDLFLNRELTWLNFNFRVLHQARDPRVPLLERMRFLSIVSGNLDEFFMKRIGGLKQQVGARVRDLTVDGRTPAEQVEMCYDLIRTLEQNKREVLRDLLEELAEHEIELVAYGSLPKEDQDQLRAHYIENIYPLVTPQSTDPAHPFPFVSNLSLNLLVTLCHTGEATTHVARVKVPVGVGIPRLLPVAGRNTFVTLESVMAHNLELLFPGMEIRSCEFFRVTRNANTEKDEENADDLVDLIESELRERKLAPIVRLEVEGGMNPIHRGMLAAELGLNEESDVFEVQGLLGPRALEKLTQVAAANLRYPAFHPLDHPLLTTDRSIFHTIRERGAVLLHHPYQSYTSSVERFLHEASRDPKVRAIKMTFYRTSEDSNAIRYLMDAAQNGKQVAVVMELKARFDEEANLRWANRLGRVGIHVTYGVMGLKTHCKVILVVRQDFDGLRRYAHIGTGNYHAETARSYADVGLLTCDDQIGRDCTELFNYLTTGYKPKRSYKKLRVAPKGLKKAIVDMIDREIDHAESGRDGLIQFKMNALEDPDVTRCLYSASQAGVKVDLIVRDTCRLRPGIAGLSENVSVMSVVGRYLEHSRVYHFGNAGAPEYFIASADCMSRNLESRVEIMAPVEDPALKEQLRFMLDVHLNDQRSVWDMSPDGSYSQRQPPDKAGEVGSQLQFMRWAESVHKKATRLKRRQIKGLQQGNLPR